MTLQQFLLILWARRGIALLALLLTASVTLAVSLVLTKQYRASTSVVIDLKAHDPIAGLAMPVGAMVGYMATQDDIIKSLRVAGRVVEELQLDRNPEIRQQWQESTDGQGNIRAWLGELLLKNLDVRPSREGNVITIGFQAADPRFAAAVANTFAQAYIDTAIELRVEPARQYNQYFETQMKAKREALEAAQSRLSEYQREKGIVVTDERLNFENLKLNELQTQLVIAEAQIADAQSKRGGGDTIAEVMQSPLINQIKADIARAEARLSEQTGNLGKNHPQYQRLEAELASLRQRLAIETRHVTAAVGTASRVGIGKQAELRAAIEAHKQHILRIKTQRDEAAVLLRQVETAQRAYDLVAQRLTQTTLESQNTQANIAILTPAEPPLKHSSPKIVLNLVLAVFLGTLLGIGAALAMELLDRRIRSPEDLAEALGLPVLATIDGRGRKPRRLARA